MQTQKRRQRQSTQILWDSVWNHSNLVYTSEFAHGGIIKWWVVSEKTIKVEAEKLKTQQIRREKLSGFGCVEVILIIVISVSLLPHGCLITIRHHNAYGNHYISLELTL